MYLEGRDVDIVVKELAAVDSHSNRVTSYVFKRPYGWEEIPMFIGRMNEAIDHWRNWNGDVIYLELETGRWGGIICCCILLLRTSENTIYQRYY